MEQETKFSNSTDPKACYIVYFLYLCDLQSFLVPGSTTKKAYFLIYTPNVNFTSNAK